MRIRYYLNLWREYTRLNVETWTEYRLDFFVGLIAMFASNLTSIVLFWALFQNIASINGWTFWQLVFLSGLTALTVGIWHFALSGIAPWSFERHIRKGTFDRYLIKPANPFVTLLVSHINNDGLGDLIAGVLIVYLGATMSGITFGLENILLLSSFVIGSVLIFFSIMIVITALAFWVTRSGPVGDIVWSLMRFTDFPLEIYGPIITFILTFVVPLGFISYYPAEVLLGRTGFPIFAYFTPLIGVALLAMAYRFWKHGMKNYTSAGG